MKIVISPAKSLDYESSFETELETTPRFLNQSEQLAQSLSKLSAEKIGDLMSISPKLADLNKERFDVWKKDFDPSDARQAVYAFKGDVYVGLDAYSLNTNQQNFLQDHLRILSGLYGVLKPMDLMQPYRLEMGTKWGVNDKKNLYEFWKETVTTSLNEELKDDPVLINLASNEYFKSVDKKKLEARIITPNFKDFKGDKYKVISFFAKKARGLMVRYIVDNKITDPEQLKGFNYEGYIYNDELSKGDEWIFTRG
ncbi:peroxide stress protein YaaA [Flammeovirga agarivorans]|uniref:UPF0246 protein HGP29_06195 n=1 Tax=Flammeovirga agarivorans TaxID=2726742 RepID=A0A7X8SIF4_9BACT|nr:peroxide stress protein YaaA [Flammeovirga agarivorans]NLR90786.1 peroxide stress protein YaaA [Flammeovirga agarivorans]